MKEEVKDFKLTKENVKKGYLVLVNSDYNLEFHSDNLTVFNNEYKNIELDLKANNQLHIILDKINSGNQIVPVSGYRSLEEQVDIYNSSLKENGLEFTKKFVALPNASEHQTGLAIDLALNKEDIDFICPSFPYDGICEDFRIEAPNYGFIERYHNHKKDITKISKEEWHFRYVGYPHSKIITDNDFCLEEYIDYLKQFDYPNNPLIIDKYKIFYIPYLGENETIKLKNNYEISGNNVDGFILTIGGIDD